MVEKQDNNEIYHEVYIMTESLEKNLLNGEEDFIKKLERYLHYRKLFADIKIP